MANQFFTADTHFGHEKIIQHSKRPFRSVDDMDESLIANWNAVVGERDEVYHLGDFNFRSERAGKTTEDYVKRLHGRIHIVWGNHDDKYAKLYARLFASAQEVKYLRLNNEKITLYHYAQRVWRNSHHGAWHLFGHSHGCLPRYHRSMDVGVDAQGYRPISFDEIKVYMETQSTVSHHPELLTDPWDKSEGRPMETKVTL